MNRSIWRWGLLLLMLVSLPALACNLVSGDEVESPPGGEESGDTVGTDEDTGAEQIPTAPAGDVDEPAGDGPAFPELGALNDALAQFSSYRTQVDMQFEDGGDSSQSSGTMTINTSRILEPPATSVEMMVSGNFAEESEALGENLTLSFIEVGDTSYSIVPGLGCVSGMGGAELADEFDTAFDADDLTDELNNPEYVGEETINGVATHHYRFDETNITQENGELRDVRGDIFISQEHQYVVRMVVDGVGDMGDDDQPSEGNIHFELNVLDVDQSFTIDVPAECDSAAAEFPVMEGASELTTFAGLTTYSVNATLEDVVAFYEEEMALRGYESSEDSFFTEGTALMTFVAEGQPTVSVTLGTEDGEVTVLIASVEN